MIRLAGISCPVPDLDFDLFTDKKHILNSPNGDFFYDPWLLLPEFKNTIVEKLLNTLPSHGEARIIKLEPGELYMCHADIDDRYHLNLQGNKSYLIDLVNNRMYPTNRDNQWYIMDAGRLHSAANFGDIPRYQLVVRSLLRRNNLDDPIRLRVICLKPVFNLRYIFDNTISPWLNWANKNQIITDFFSPSETWIEFTVENEYLDDLRKRLPGEISVIQI